MFFKIIVIILFSIIAPSHLMADVTGTDEVRCLEKIDITSNDNSKSNYKLTTGFKDMLERIDKAVYCQKDNQACKDEISHRLDRLLKLESKPEALPNAVEELLLADVGSASGSQVMAALINQGNSGSGKGLASGIDDFVDKAVGGERLEFYALYTGLDKGLGAGFDKFGNSIGWDKETGFVKDRPIKKLTEGRGNKLRSKISDTLTKVITPKSFDRAQKVAFGALGSGSLQAFIAVAGASAIMSLNDKKDEIQYKISCNDLSKDLEGSLNQSVDKKVYRFLDYTYTFKGELTEDIQAQLISEAKRKEIRDDDLCKPDAAYTDETAKFVEESDEYQVEKMLAYPQICSQLKSLDHAFTDEQASIDLTVKSCKSDKIEVEIGKPYSDVLGPRVDYYGAYDDQFDKTYTFQAYFPAANKVSGGYLNTIKYNVERNGNDREEASRICIFPGNSTCITNKTLLPATMGKKCDKNNKNCREIMSPIGKKIDLPHCLSNKACPNLDRHNQKNIHLKYTLKKDIKTEDEAVKNLYIVDSILSKPRYEIETCCNRLMKNGSRDPYVEVYCQGYGDIFKKPVHSDYTSPTANPITTPGKSGN